jgi:hypothetical protein
MRGIEDRILSMSNRTDGLAGRLIWTFSLGGNMITSGRFCISDAFLLASHPKARLPSGQFS